VALWLEVESQVSGDRLIMAADETVSVGRRNHWIAGVSVAGVQCQHSCDWGSVCCMVWRCVVLLLVCSQYLAN